MYYNNFRRIQQLRHFDPFRPSFALAGSLPNSGNLPKEDKVGDALKSNVDFYSSNEKGRTARMVSFAKKNKELAKIEAAKKAKIMAEQKAEEARNKKPLQKASKKQIAAMKKKWK